MTNSGEYGFENNRVGMYVYSANSSGACWRSGPEWLITITPIRHKYFRTAEKGR